MAAENDDEEIEIEVDSREFTILFSETEGIIRFNGLMRLRSSRDYDRVRELLRSAYAADVKVLTLDLRGLSFLSSSALSAIGQFIVEARETPRRKIVLLGSTQRDWQPQALGTLKQIWDEVDLVLE